VCLKNHNERKTKPPNALPMWVTARRSGRCATVKEGDTERKLVGGKAGICGQRRGGIIRHFLISVGKRRGREKIDPLRVMTL